LGVDPIHHLVDFGPLLEVLRIGRRADLVGEILQDRRALGQAEAVVLERRHQAVGIDARIVRLQVGAGHHIDEDLLDRDIALGDEQAHRTARHRDGVHVELHR
jgi:hypothetical protein